MKFTLLAAAAFSLFIVSCKDTKDKETKKEETTETSDTKQSSGNDDEKVKDVLDQYKAYTVKEDFEGMISFVSPSLLAQTSKEDLIAELKAGMHNENYDLRITDIDYTELSKVVEKDGDKYAKAKTNTSATFKLKDASTFQGFCDEFKKQNDNVTCNEAESSVSIMMKGEAYVVYTSKDSKWSILADTDPRNVEKVIPADVRTELGIVLKNE
jgi:hypothetical protein